MLVLVLSRCGKYHSEVLRHDKLKIKSLSHPSGVVCGVSICDREGEAIVSKRSPFFIRN